MGRGRLKIDWTKQPLGEMSDAKVAEKLGVGWRTVFRRRTELGIPSFQENKKKDRRSKLSLELLGTVTDKQFADSNGITVGMTYSLRKELGIPSYSNRSHVSERMKNDWDNGKMSGTPREIDLGEIEQLLGKLPDKEIAAKFGVHFSTIYNIRAKLGIPAYNAKERNRYLKKEVLRPILEMRVFEDSELAELLGITSSRVQEVRCELGIPCRSHRNVCVCGNSNSRASRYCSVRCINRMRSGRGVIGIAVPRENKKKSRTEAEQQVDDLCWALSTLNTTIAKKSGAYHWDRKRR